MTLRDEIAKVLRSHGTFPGQIKYRYKMADEILALLRPGVEIGECVVVPKPIDDGRPCSADMFLVALSISGESLTGPDFTQALDHWAHGAWGNALVFLSDEGRAMIAATKEPTDVSQT